MSMVTTNVTSEKHADNHDWRCVLSNLFETTVVVILFYRESEGAGLRRRDPSVCVHPLLTSFACPPTT